MTEAYPLISHGSLYRNTPCEWHPPNPVPKGYPRKQGKWLICINLWLTHWTQEKGMKEKSGRKMNSYWKLLSLDEITARGRLIGSVVYQVELKESNGGAEEEKP